MNYFEIWISVIRIFILVLTVLFASNFCFDRIENAKNKQGMKGFLSIVFWLFLIFAMVTNIVVEWGMVMING